MFVVKCMYWWEGSKRITIEQGEHETYEAAQEEADRLENFCSNPDGNKYWVETKHDDGVDERLQMLERVAVLVAQGLQTWEDGFSNGERLRANNYETPIHDELETLLRKLEIRV